MKRAILSCLVLAACAGGAEGGARTRAELVGEILARLEVTHARTMEACAIRDRPCAAASFAATAALSRMRSDLVALRVPSDLAVAKRRWIESLDVYARANDSLVTPACSGGNRGACVQAVEWAMEQAKRSLEGATAAVGGGVAAR
jgi:hypothetical protein